MNHTAGRKTEARSVWGTADGANCYCRFLQTFSAAPDAPCTLRIRADSNYIVWLNGEYVGAGQYSDYPFYAVCDTYDVSALICGGENTLAVLGYCLNEASSVYRPGKPAVIFSVAQNGVTVCASGKDTFWAPCLSYLSGTDCEKFSDQLSYGFAYDASKEDGWLSPEYRRGAQWRRCTVSDGEEPALHERPVARLTQLPPVTAKLVAQGVFTEDPSEPSRALRMQRAALSSRYRSELLITEDGREPDAPRTLPDGSGIRFDDREPCVYAVIDLGRETAGWLSLDIDADYGTRIDIAFGEHLEDLRVRARVGNRCFAVGYTATQGRQRFVHRMKRLGCRYLQLHIHGRARLYYAGLIPTVYPVTERGTLRIGDRLHERIYRTCIDTLRLCMHEHYEDCPWREQALYAMDSHHQMLYGYYVFGEKTFAQGSLRLLAMGQRPDGLLELCAPASVPATIPSFSLHFVIALWEHLLFCGDFAFAEELLPTAERIVEAFRQRLESCGLVRRFVGKEYWNFYEWTEGLVGALFADEPEPVFDLPLNALYAMALDAVGRLCRELGREQAAGYFVQRDAVIAAVNENFWDRCAGLYLTCCDGSRRYGLHELSQALAVCCGAAGARQRDTVLPVLARRGGTLAPVTLAGSIYRFDALMTRPETYASAVFDEAAEIWGGMLFSGATSFWETQKGAADFEDAGSMCHGWSAVPVYLYYRYGLGLYPTSPGFTGYRFAPADCGFALEGSFVSGRKKFTVAADERGKKTLSIDSVK